MHDNELVVYAITISESAINWFIPNRLQHTGTSHCNLVRRDSINYSSVMDISPLYAYQDIQQFQHR